MKGLQEANNDGIFLVIKHGGICQESKQPREGFSPIEVVNARSGDKTVKYIKRYKGVEALIKRIDWYDREFEDTRFMGWKLILDADGTPCSLDLPFESRVGSRFMKLAENIDYSEPVEFSAWRGPDDKTAFAVKQRGENVPQKYTRDEPGDCPPPVQGFNKKWNFDAQKQFLHERMVKVVIPKLQELHGNGHHAEPETEQQGNAVVDKAALLEKLKTDLKTHADQEKVTPKEAMEEFCGTRSWREVENMSIEMLRSIAEKVSDELLPF
jgi:hypothetical protein